MRGIGNYHPGFFCYKSARYTFSTFFICCIIGCSLRLTVSDQENNTGLTDPVNDYGELFVDVQVSGVFKDSKKFVDCNPLVAPDSIRVAYKQEKANPGFNLRSFVGQYFDTVTSVNSVYVTDTTRALTQHLEDLWPVLTRPREEQTNSTLIALPYSYVVPGGRFNEIYYWDSYFTMLGLKVSGKDSLLKNMVKNFTYLIETFDHIPNGNRSYYLSRSQPPFYSLMVELLAEIESKDSMVNYLPALEREYNFWMKGQEVLSKQKKAVKRVVLLDDSTVLNRYWDSLSTPRPESYRQDVAVFQLSKRDSTVFKDIRAAAESGWDFSSRWFRDGKSLESIHTTAIIPVDLNCLLYHLEKVIAEGYELKQDTVMKNKYNLKAKKRKDAIVRYLWSGEDQFFMDYDMEMGIHTNVYSLAGVFPLFLQVADSIHAYDVEEKIKADFIKAGGAVTTLTNHITGQQWDYPNGWAPLQWITYKGLINYGYAQLAKELANNWMSLNERVFKGLDDPQKKGKMLEKYNVVIGSPGKGGEYKLQDGFGWTNGVYLKLWSELNP